jgi:hypothetical protein
MKRREFLAAAAALPALTVTMPDGTRGTVVPKVIPAPSHSKILGPAVLDESGKRIGQMVFVTVAGATYKIPVFEQ